MLPSKVTFPILIIRQNNNIHFSQSEVGKSKMQVWEPRPHPLMRMPQTNLPNQSRSLKHRNSAPLGSPLGRVESKELGGSDTLKLPCLGLVHVWGHPGGDPQWWRTRGACQVVMPRLHSSTGTQLPTAPSTHYPEGPWPAEFKVADMGPGPTQGPSWPRTQLAQPSWRAGIH